jgi:predicted dehydrogenase
MACMKASSSALPSRREFIRTSTQLAAASAFAGLTVPYVHAAGSDLIRLALVGCGGRGTGAVADALAAERGPVKLVAMADVFANRLQTSITTLVKNHPAGVDVPADRRFVGLKGYRPAMDCLQPGDVVILTTPPAFRWVHFQYAIAKGLNVFMEKPVTVDGPTSRRMLALGEESVKKNLKVGVGLMCRHCAARQQLYDEIKAGRIGDLVLLRAYRLIGKIGLFWSEPKPAEANELLWQIERFHSFLWASGGAFSDFNIHNIDECCWMKDAWPVKAQALGGRHYREKCVDQNFDTYAVEYTFADGAKLQMNGRCITGCHDEFASYAHGTKGAAVISAAAHTPARCKIYAGQDIENSQPVWRAMRQEPNPYVLEWTHLLTAIRQNQPYNEVRRGVEASVVTSMGRMAAHTGQVVTYEDMLNCEHEFAPGLDQLTEASPAPLRTDANGRYPVPQPGITVKREY